MRDKRKIILKALKSVNLEIAGNANSGGLYARGLSSEGYAGGYRQALSDVLILMGGTMPNTRGYWPRDDISILGQLATNTANTSKEK